MAQEEKPRPKQDALNEKSTLEKDLLLGLHKKRDYGLETDQDRKEMNVRKNSLQELEKKSKER